MCTVKVTVDGHNDARNMLRYKFDNKHQISCIFLVFLSSHYFRIANVEWRRLHMTWHMRIKCWIP